jgi:hypothetical protein
VTLTLRRASTLRPSGSWKDEDFDVFNCEQCVGRIYRVTDQPNSLWFWGVSFQVTRRKSYGYESSLDSAEEAFKAAYENWKNCK